MKPGKRHSLRRRYQQHGGQKKKASGSNRRFHVNLLFVFRHFQCAAIGGTTRVSMARQKQTLHGEISVGFCRLLSQLSVAGLVAEGTIIPQHAPNGGERLVHRRKRLGIVNVRSEIWRGH
jgi:hypothetical protein